MRGGFSFCGVDIADIGLEYAPENKDTYVYAPTNSNMHEETFEGHDGGYSYGATKEPKVFTLRCFYENEHIAEGLMAKVFDLFKVGKKGLLVFKRRPWCYYYATVTSKPDIEEMYSYLNGSVVITLKAYYPFARACSVTKDNTEAAAKAHLFYNTLQDPYHDEIMLNTGVFDKDYMVLPTTFGSPTPITSQTSVLLYNPGTERAKVDIVISGTAGSGVTIANSTTGQSCRYVAFNTTGNQFIYTDGINGKTVLDDNGVRELAFLYHDHGFIELEPAFPILREVYVDYTGTTVTAVNMLYQEEEEKDWYAGKYIFIGNNSSGSWKKINRCLDQHRLQLTQSVAAGSCRTCIVKMNEITITPTQGTSLNRLSFIYLPTYA
jgi:phage-related protein